MNVWLFVPSVLGSLRLGVRAVTAQGGLMLSGSNQASVLIHQSDGGGVTH